MRGLILIHLTVGGTSGCSLSVLVIQIQYVFKDCLTIYSWRMLVFRHQEGSKVVAYLGFFFLRGGIRKALKASDTFTCQGACFLTRLGLGSSWGLQVKALVTCSLAMSLPYWERRCIFLMFKPKWWMCRSCHHFSNSKSVFPVETDSSTFLYKNMWC